MKPSSLGALDVEQHSAHWGQPCTPPQQLVLARGNGGAPWACPHFQVFSDIPFFSSTNECFPLLETKTDFRPLYAKRS